MRSVTYIPLATDADYTSLVELCHRALARNNMPVARSAITALHALNGGFYQGSRWHKGGDLWMLEDRMHEQLGQQPPKHSNN